MMTPAHLTASYLAALADFGSFGGSADWSLYVSREPLEPVRVVTVYDTGGAPAVLLPRLRNPSIQVRVRSDTYNAGWQKLNTAYQALVAETSYDADDGVRVVGWMPTSDILFLGRDDKDRYLMTVNFNVLRDYVPA